MEKYLNQDLKRKNIVLKKKSSKLENISSDGEKMPIPSANQLQMINSFSNGFESGIIRNLKRDVSPRSFNGISGATA